MSRRKLEEGQLALALEHGINRESTYLTYLKGDSPFTVSFTFIAVMGIFVVEVVSLTGFRLDYETERRPLRRISPGRVHL